MKLEEEDPVKTVAVTADVPGDAYWVAQNSVLFFTIATLTGVSVTFSPLLLYQLGREGVGWSDWRLWTCFCVTYLVPMFYVRIGGAVATRAWKDRRKERSVGASGTSNSAA
jgi:hypothetical protein